MSTGFAPGGVPALGSFFAFPDRPDGLILFGKAMTPRQWCDRFRGGIWKAGQRDPMVPLALAALGGIVAADRLLDRVPPALGLGMALAGLAWGCGRGSRAGSVIPAVFSVYLFAHAVTLWAVDQFPFAPNLRRQETVRVEALGWVTEAPPVGEGPGVDRSLRCTIRFTEFAAAGHRWHCDQRLPVRIARPGGPIRYGDRLVLTGQLRPLEPPAVPGAFDPRAFYFRKLGALGELAVGPGDRVEVLARDEGNPLIAWANRSHAFLSGAITRGLADRPDEAAVIRAMVLGAREDTPEHIEEAYQLSGAMHVFSVSGLHVAIFGSVIWWLLRSLRVPRRAAVGLLIPTILFYATVTGLPASAVRAALMGSAVLLSPLVERPSRLPNSLGLAALVILAADTQQLFQAGFQLSFAVLAAMILAAGPVQSLLRRPWSLDPFLPRRLVPRWRLGADRAVDWLSKSLGVSIAAWAGSALLIAHHFHIITPVAVVANVFMVPASFLVLATAIASLLLTLVGGGALAGGVINPLNGWLAHGLTRLAVFFAGVPSGSVHVAAGSPLPDVPESGVRLVVWEPNAGGLSQLLSARRGGGAAVHWLIDPGDPGGFLRAGQPLLRQAGINRLQCLVLTHGDFDHLGAAPGLIGRYAPAAVLDTPFDSRSSAYPDILATLARTETRHLRLARGDRIPIDAGTDVTVLFPPREGEAAGLADDRCLVLRCRHGDWRILLTADSGFSTEKWLLEREAGALKADVWVKGWHASDSSGLTEFLDRVDPAVVITTHREFPETQRVTPAWREALEARGIALYTVTEDGAVMLEADRSRLDVRSQTGRRGPTLPGRPGPGAAQKSR